MYMCIYIYIYEIDCAFVCSFSQFLSCICLVPCFFPMFPCIVQCYHCRFEGFSHAHTTRAVLGVLVYGPWHRGYKKPPGHQKAQQGHDRQKAFGEGGVACQDQKNSRITMNEFTGQGKKQMDESKPKTPKTHRFWSSF